MSTRCSISGARSVPTAALCQEACPERAVEFEDRMERGGYSRRPSWKVIGRIQLTWCTFCGETLAHGEGEVCPTCDKRRVGAFSGGWQ